MDKKTEVVITVNSKQPVAAVRAMETELKKLQNTYQQLVKAGKAGTERAKTMAHEIKELSIAIKEGKANMEQIVSVTNNLSQSSLSQLQRALRQVKKEMSRVSTDSTKLDDLRTKYKAISDQIKILTGEMLNIQKHISNLSGVTDSWLQKAIQQQKNLVQQTRQGTSEYNKQMAVLSQLSTEQAKRAVSTISSGTASAEQLRSARANLISHRDMIGSGGIQVQGGNAAEIAKINEELKKADAQLDTISGKEQKIELSTQEIATKANQIALDPAKFTPKEIETALATVNEQLKKIPLNDPFRKQLKQSATQLKAILDGVDKELIDIKNLLQPQNLKKASLDQLKQAAAQLEKEMAKLNRDNQEYINKKGQLAAVKGEIESATGAVHKHSSAWQTTLRNMSAYFGAFQLFSMAIQKVQAFFRLNLKFSDQLADIRKVSGLAMSEINDLANSLAKLDTRTTIQELNEIAYAGAKLGMGKYGTAGLEQFVRAANQVNVALKEDLGADALTALSKITEVMGLIPKMGVEKSMLAVGSAMFQLSATSTATSGNIVEFSKRLTGMARTAGITTDQLLALGSAADAMYLMPEVASTAFNKLITSLQTKHNLIEKELQIEPGTINNLYSAGKTMDAIVLILEKMKEKGNMNALQGVFKDLGSEGARLVNVMVTMSKNVDILKDHLYTSEEAFNEATAVTNEYNIQQETANALMERASNIWEKAFINPEGVDAVKSMALQWYNFSDALTHSNLYMTQIKGTLSLLIVMIKLFLVLLPTLAQYFMFVGAQKAILGIVAAFRAMRTAILGAKVAQDALNTSMKLNPWGLAAAGIATLVFWIADYGEKTEEATEKQKDFNFYLDEAAKKVDNEKRKLDSYLAVLNDTNTSVAERERIIKKFNHDYQSYLTKLGIEVTNVNDLKDAYVTLNEEIKKKMYYQMKEQAYDDMLGEASGGVSSTLMAYSKYVNKEGSYYSGFDTKWLQSQVDAGREAQEIYRNLIETVWGAGGFWSGYDKKYVKGRDTIGDSTLENLIAKFVSASKNYAKTKDEIDKAFDPVIGDYNPFKDEDNGTLDEDARDKEEERRRKAEEAARRKALRAEMRDEQQKAKAIIDNVKNYYERQIAAITEMATNTGMSEEWQTKMVDGMTNRMNQALAEVRKAISGTENDWATFRESMIADLYEPLGDDGTNESTQLLDNIVHNDINQLKAMIVTLSKELGQNGSVLLDQIWRKATENQLANIKAQNKQFQARQKVLLEKNYTGKVNRDYENQMEQLGIAELTSKQSQDLMLWSQADDQDKIQEFVKQRSDMWQEAFLNAREHMVEVFAADVSTEDGQKAMLTLLFGENYEEVLTGSALESMLNMNLDQWKVFHTKLLEMSDAYVDAQRKAYDEAKRRADYLFEQRPDIQNIDNLEMGLSAAQRTQDRFGDNLSLGQQMGLKSNFGPDANGVERDPELMLLKLKAERARLYFEEMQRLRDQDKISEEQLTEAKSKMMEAQMNMSDKMADKIKERAQLLQSFTEPIATFAEGVGEYLGNMLSETEDTNVKMKDLAKDMLKSMVKMTIKLMAEELTRMVTKEIYRKEDEANEMLHQETLLAMMITFGTLMNTAQATIDTTRLTQKAVADDTELTEEASMTTAKVSLGIASGAAKTIASLGWWGIPLIAVISALLMGLLSWAISAAFGSSDSKSDSGPNVKLASGMLTYDSGNVQAFRGVEDGKTYPVVGNDGKVYAAKDGGKLETGLVKDPITTLVNGQPALVAEKGPEMVIGRETTAAMMMARPDLLAEIVKFDKNRSGQTYRAYDSGNVQEIATASIGSADGNALSPADIAALRSSLDGFAAVMTLIQKNGLHVNKYGRGSVTQESADGAAFMRRNSGDRLWRKG